MEVQPSSEVPVRTLWGHPALGDFIDQRTRAWSTAHSMGVRGGGPSSKMGLQLLAPFTRKMELS